MSEPTPTTYPITTYPITTLRDIWALPSYEHMERCLAEVSKAMLHARAINDLWGAAGEVINANAPRIRFAWPETLDWVDDGKGEVGANWRGFNGETALTTRITRDPTRFDADDAMCGVPLEPRE